MFVLELFGTLVLRTDNGPVPPAALQKRRVGLLAILALGGRAGISRHRIEAYLWPESTAERARHALDQAVYAIRRSLGSDVIVGTAQELALNPGRFRVDLWEFTDAVRAGDWLAASETYKGSLLEGFHAGDSRELESWIDGERARHLRDCQTAIEHLADRSAAAGDHSQDVNWRRRLAVTDPLSAGTAKKLINALAASGDRAGAVRQARQYQALVRRELEIEPDAAIEGLAATFSHASANEPRHVLAPRVEQGARPASPEAALPVRAPASSRRRTLAFASMAILLATLIGAGIVATERPERQALTGSAPATNRRSHLPVPAALQAYLAGVAAWEDRTKEGNDRAVAFFRRATELDPEYAEAYAELAEAYVRIGYFGYRPSEAMFPKAKAAALRSMALDGTLAAPHTALATELIWEHDFAGAEAESRKAISLEPNNATAHQWYGVLLMILRRIPESLAEEKRASELEPLSLQIQNNYAAFLNASGDHAGALRHFERSIGEEPDSTWVRRNPWLLANMARVYADNGRYAAAVQSMQRALRIVPNSPRALHTMAVIYHEMGRVDLARRAFAAADTSNEQYAAYRGMTFVSEGKPDSAFAWFGRARSWGVQTMVSLQADQRLDGVREDPRFLDLLARLRIPVAR